MATGTEYRSLASVAATREVLDRFGLQAKYSYGQNFLVNDGVLRKIAALAQVGEGDQVLEVGPGIGTLTSAMLHAGAQVLAVEYDSDLPPVLAETCALWADRFAVVGKDALRLTAGDCEARGFVPAKLVSNLPYEVAATVVLQYLDTFPSIRSMTFMVQREVADRMMAAPGGKDYGAYTVKLALRAEASGRFEVPASNFFPKPRVESAVVRLDRVQLAGAEGAPLAPDALAAASVAADAAFATRRKTIANSAKAYFSQRGDADGSRLRAFLAAADVCGINRSVRGETLSVADFARLGEALSAERE